MAQRDFDKLLKEIRVRVQRLLKESKKMTAEYQRLKNDIDRLQTAYEKASREERYNFD